MSRHRLAAALAALAAALAVALPASASAATSSSTVTPVPIGTVSGLFQSLICPLLVTQLHIAVALNNAQLQNLTASLLFNLGCGGAAI
jgi:hypothetical protein